MPEGPEIRRAADRIAKVLDGKVAEEVYFEQRGLRSFENVLAGERVERVTSRGKALLTRFDCGLSLYSHNQLYGRWYVMRRGRKPKTNRTLRVAIHTSTHSALLYSASDIAVLDEAGLGAHPYLTRLGPDALDLDVEWRDVAARLRDKAFHRRRLSALYLDQSFVAGIGNYLRSEILFDARLEPTLRPCDLSRAEVGRLARSTLSITRRSLETGGITNPPGRVRALKADGLTRRRYRFAVFGRTNQPCYRCDWPIERIEAGSRRLYLCPSCQPERLA